MKLLVDGFEAAGVDVRVALGGGNARVAEHLLDVAEVDAPGHEVRGETVPQRVGTDVGRDAGLVGVKPHDLPNPHP